MLQPVCSTLHLLQVKKHQFKLLMLQPVCSILHSLQVKKHQSKLHVNFLFVQFMLTILLMHAADAELWTTGSNDSCQLGHKGHETQLYPSRVQALDAHGVCQVACGQQHMLAVADGGALCAWGAADLGQLGMHTYPHTHMHMHALPSLHYTQKHLNLDSVIVCICVIIATIAADMLVTATPYPCFNTALPAALTPMQLLNLSPDLASLRYYTHQAAEDTFYLPSKTDSTNTHIN